MLIYFFFLKNLTIFRQKNLKKETKRVASEFLFTILFVFWKHKVLTKNKIFKIKLCYKTKNNIEFFLVKPLKETANL